MSGRQPCLSSPLCRYAYLAIPLYPRSSPPDQHSGRWPGLRPFLSWLEGRPVTHCQLAQPACLLRLLGRIPPLPFACLCSLSILPRIIPRRGRCGAPFPSLSSPLLGASRSPLYHYLEFLGFLGVPSAVLCFLFFPDIFACALYSRLWICSVFLLIRLRSLRPLTLSFRPITPFPTTMIYLSSSCIPDSTLSTFGSVTRVILLLRTYLAVSLQVYMLEGTSPSHVCFF